MPFTPQPDYHKAYEAFRPRPFVWPHETADPPTSESQRNLERIERRLERIEAMLARLIKHG